jgi:hypothetical protein
MTMLNMNHEDLGKELMRLRHDIPVILCTGYADSKKGPRPWDSGGSL